MFNEEFFIIKNKEISSTPSKGILIYILSKEFYPKTYPMIDITKKNFAIRQIIGKYIDCEFDSVIVTIDEKKVFEEVKALYPEEQFVDKIDQTFESIGEVRLSGVLNLYYDPDYRFILTLHYQPSLGVYGLTLRK